MVTRTLASSTSTERWAEGAAGGCFVEAAAGTWRQDVRGVGTGGSMPAAGWVTATQHRTVNPYRLRGPPPDDDDGRGATLDSRPLWPCSSSAPVRATSGCWTCGHRTRWHGGWGALLLLVAFLGRILYLQGWYIITYALGIYHLNLFIAFLTPKVDPALGADDYEDGPELPTRVNEEFRPFIRRLPEFKFWYSATKATLVAIACTFFDAFNVPVFWPILLLYFITLFCLTMKRQIKHMLKYRYLPWTHGKTQYRARDMASGPLNSIQEL
ncbi:hypothetical protein MTO96_021882 [Rhipicephalus appendiculatus]